MRTCLPNEIPNTCILTYNWNADYDTNAYSDAFLGRIHTEQDAKVCLNDDGVIECKGGGNRRPTETTGD